MEIELVHLTAGTLSFVLFDALFDVGVKLRVCYRLLFCGVSSCVLRHLTSCALLSTLSVLLNFVCVTVIREQAPARRRRSACSAWPPAPGASSPPSSSGRSVSQSLHSNRFDATRWPVCLHLSCAWPIDPMFCGFRPSRLSPVRLLLMLCR